MMKKIISLVMSLFLLLPVTGCDNTEKTQGSVQETSARNRNVIVTTDTAIYSLVSELLKDTNQDIHLIKSDANTGKITEDEESLLARCDVLIDTGENGDFFKSHVKKDIVDISKNINKSSIQAKNNYLYKKNFNDIDSDEISESFISSNSVRNAKIIEKAPYLSELAELTKVPVFALLDGKQYPALINHIKASPVNDEGHVVLYDEENSIKYKFRPSIYFDEAKLVAKEKTENIKKSGNSGDVSTQAVTTKEEVKVFLDEGLAKKQISKENYYWLNRDNSYIIISTLFDYFNNKVDATKLIQNRKIMEDKIGLLNKQASAIKGFRTPYIIFLGNPSLYNIIMNVSPDIKIVSLYDTSTAEEDNLKDIIVYMKKNGSEKVLVEKGLSPYILENLRVNIPNVKVIEIERDFNINEGLSFSNILLKNEDKVLEALTEASSLPSE